MTSKLTRERVVALIAEHSYDSALVDALEHLLAAMDSEPVAYTDERNLGYIDRGRETAYLWGKQNSESSDVALYRHAQPAPVVPEEATPDSIEILASARRRDHAVFQWDEDQRNAAADSWNAFRAAMLQELKKSAGTEAICRSDENVQVLHTKSPAQSDCCPAQNVVVPAQSPIDHGYLPECECSGCKATARICTEMAVNSLVIPNEMTSEQAYEIGYYYGDPVNVFARGANWMRQHIIDSTLAAAPQLPGSDPATVPGQWIPVSERMPEDEQEVLTINRMGHRFVSFFDKHSGLFFDRLDAPAACCIEHVLVTHWMPLPAGPQEVR